MPKMKITKRELLNLLEKVHNITEEDLSNNPKYLLLLRLNLGMSQNEFEKFLGISKNSYKYETGKIKRMSKRTAKKFLARLPNSIDRKKVIKSYKHFKAESKGWMMVHSDSEQALRGRQKGAINSMKKRCTIQEKEITNYLLKKAVPFKRNYALNNRCVVDFIIEHANVIIECKRLSTQNRREQTKKIRELAYQGYKAKFLNPKFALIALIETQLPLTAADYEELMGPFNKVFNRMDELFSFLDQTI